MCLIYRLVKYNYVQFIIATYHDTDYNWSCLTRIVARISNKKFVVLLIVYIFNQSLKDSVECLTETIGVITSTYYTVCTGYASNISLFLSAFSAEFVICIRITIFINTTITILT